MWEQVPYEKDVRKRTHVAVFGILPTLENSSAYMICLPTSPC